MVGIISGTSVEGAERAVQSPPMTPCHGVQLMLCAKLSGLSCVSCVWGKVGMLTVFNWIVLELLRIVYSGAGLCSL